MIKVLALFGGGVLALIVVFTLTFLFDELKKKIKNRANKDKKLLSLINCYKMATNPHNVKNLECEIYRYLAEKSEASKNVSKIKQQ